MLSDRRAAYQKKWYDNNKDKAAAYRLANKTKISAQKKKLYWANKDRVNAHHKAYQKSNIAKLAALQCHIAQIRKDKGMTQRMPAEQLGVSPQTVSHWENGRVPAKWDKLCVALPELAEYRP